MKKVRLFALALAGVSLASNSPAISLDDVQFWTGSGTNRAALIVEWNAPIVINQSTVPPPITTKTMVWGYRFNGNPSATQMLYAIVAADKRLYAIETIDPTYGAGVDTIGYNLDGTGQFGVSDGTSTYHATNFVNGLMVGPTLIRDAAVALNPGDLYWSGHYGPNWVQWSEATYSGGLSNSPNRGTNQYFDPNTFAQGEWGFGSGLDYTTMFDGSWLGFNVGAAGYPTNEVYTPEDDTNYAIASTDVAAPPSPDGTYTAYLYHSNDFAVNIVSTNNVYGGSPYNNPNAMLGRPTLKFLDHFGDHTAHRTKIVEPPYWTDPNSNNVITEISSNGQITVNLGRKIYDDPGNPYGVDFIVYGNSFYSASGGGFISDKTDLDVAQLGGYGGHSTTVSVSQDGNTWYTYTNIASLFPDNAYHWDTESHTWTDEEMSPTKPVNPYIYNQSFSGQSVSSALDQFGGAAGGTGFALRPSGYPWIQYVRLEPALDTYTVIDAIAAVNPVVVGDALTIAPTNLANGVTNLTFRKEDGSSNTLICLNFNSVSDVAKVSTIALSEFSAYAPAFGNVSSAYQITVKPLTNSTPVSYAANVGLRAGDNYSGDGSDLVVYQWTGTSWTNTPFTYNSTNQQVTLAGVTNLTTFTVSQIAALQLSINPVVNGNGFQFAPMPGVQYTLQRSLDFLTWTNVTSMTPMDSQPVTLQDSAPPAVKAFYRLSAP